MDLLYHCDDELIVIFHSFIFDIDNAIPILIVIGIVFIDLNMMKHETLHMYACTDLAEVKVMT